MSDRYIALNGAVLIDGEDIYAQAEMLTDAQHIADALNAAERFPYRARTADGSLVVEVLAEADGWSLVRYLGDECCIGATIGTRTLTPIPDKQTLEDFAAEWAGDEVGKAARLAAFSRAVDKAREEGVLE